jgi:FAD binding domain
MMSETFVLIQCSSPSVASDKERLRNFQKRRPAAIARCVDVADVTAAVNFARQDGLTVALRGGGHNVRCLGKQLQFAGYNVKRLKILVRQLYIFAVVPDFGTKMRTANAPRSRDCFPVNEADTTLRPLM